MDAALEQLLHGDDGHGRAYLLPRPMTGASSGCR
jgi:hypothetical protein